MSTSRSPAIQGLRAFLRSSASRFKSIVGWDSFVSPRTLRSAFAAGAMPPAITVLDEEPSMTRPRSQMATISQVESAEYSAWCEAMQITPNRHRKQWEHCYILRCLESYGVLGEGRRALGFGVGTEPIPALLATRGMEVVATDMDAAGAEAHGWTETNQFAGSLDNLNPKGLCDPEEFRQRVTFRTVDMNDVPDDLGTFDAIWSSCAIEHLGDLERGFEFIQKTTPMLRPGGVAIHTTEYNLSSNTDTVVEGPVVFYRRQDLEALARHVAADGDRMELNFHPGSHPDDSYVDAPPFDGTRHMKVRLDTVVATSFGILIQKNPFAAGE